MRPILSANVSLALGSPALRRLNQRDRIIMTKIIARIRGARTNTNNVKFGIQSSILKAVPSPPCGSINKLGAVLEEVRAILNGSPETMTGHYYKESLDAIRSKASEEECWNENYQGDGVHQGIEELAGSIGYPLHGFNEVASKNEYRVCGTSQGNYGTIDIEFNGLAI